VTDSARNRRVATIALLGVCVFWGATFTWMKTGLEGLRHVLPGAGMVAIGAFFLLVRFALAALLMPVLVPASVRRLGRPAWAWGFWLSLPFAAGFLLQIVGLTQHDLPPSQSAFLTSLFVVATPVLGALVTRRLPPRGVMLGVPLALCGAAFIQGPPEGGLSLGAWLTIGCAVVFGVHILVTDVATKRADPMAVTLTMLVFSTVWMALALVVAPGGLALLDARELGAAFANTDFVYTVVLCAVLATVVAVSVLNRWQKELHPSRAAIIYTAEPVFATLISFALSDRERVSFWLFFGAAMILAANLAAELIRPRPRSTP
jgi:drug/metabolite transporter (DMT)-like permease